MKDKKQFFAFPEKFLKCQLYDFQHSPDEMLIILNH